VSFVRFRFLLALLGVKKSLVFKSPNRVVFIILIFFLGLVNCKLSVENNDLGKKLSFINIIQLFVYYYTCLLHFGVSADDSEHSV